MIREKRRLAASKRFFFEKRHLVSFFFLKKKERYTQRTLKREILREIAYFDFRIIKGM
jgi:hypothetical protein